MSFSTIRFYIILKLERWEGGGEMSFSTIRFYIILKLERWEGGGEMSFSTIRFYIILKPQGKIDAVEIVSVPYVFTSFSNHRERLTR